METLLVNRCCWLIDRQDSALCPTDRPGADFCRTGADRSLEEDSQGPQENAGENHCGGSGRNRFLGADSPGGRQDAGLPLECAGAMQNLYQIKRAGELVAKEIPQNCSLLLKSVGGNLKGTVIAAMVSDELTDAATQMTALFPFMKQLVTSGKYDVTGDDGKNEKHKVNLLNASERYYIANEVVSCLEAINTDLFILAWQVRTLSWNDLWFSLDPEGWANVMSGKNIIGGIISDWNQGYSLNGK